MNEPIQFNNYTLSNLIAENVEIKKEMWKVEKEKERLKNQVEEQYKLIEMLKDLLKGGSNEKKVKEIIDRLKEYADGFTNVLAPTEESVKELLDYINQLETNRDEAIEYIKENKFIDEVEIIEEEKIEYLRSETTALYADSELYCEETNFNNKELVDKVNEIIDEINELKKGK